MRLRVVALSALAVLLAAPSEGSAEPFSSFWSTLNEGERDFVDQVAAGMYNEERGTRTRAYDDLNIASKARFRAKAVEILGVENRPARSKKRGKDI